MIDNLKSFLHFPKGIVESTKMIVESSSNDVVNRLYYKYKVDELNQYAINSKKKGITDSKIAATEVIVSLTTHSYRINDVYLAIESIMQGTMLPNRIILWMSDEYKNNPLPITLQNQMERGLEVRYCKDIRSYTKLVPALREFPDSAIVTIDDDILYPIDALEHLVNAYNGANDCICAHWVHTIPADLYEKYTSLLDWPTATGAVEDSLLLFYEGFGGVLYPPHSLDAEVLNENVFLDICKYADDVWFNAMSLKKGTKVRYANPRPGLFKCVGNPDVQAIALRNVNSNGEILNDVQIKDVFRKYGIFEKIAAFVQNG
ncbi:MAG: hypothetical protein IJ610_07005 [Bacteroidaceae bacterium]|nr:hypothetical protein [Bacteroidaceae bacterium]